MRTIMNPERYIDAQKENKLSRGETELSRGEESCESHVDRNEIYVMLQYWLLFHPATVPFSTFKMHEHAWASALLLFEKLQNNKDPQSASAYINNG